MMHFGIYEVRMKSGDVDPDDLHPGSCGGHHLMS